MLTHYGAPLLLRLHRYVCAWTQLLFGYCECVPAVTESDNDTPKETPLQELRSLDSRAMVLP